MHGAGHGRLGVRAVCRPAPRLVGTQEASEQHGATTMSLRSGVG